MFFLFTHKLYLKLTTCIETTGFPIDNSLRTADVSPCMVIAAEGCFARRNVCDSAAKIHTDDVNQCLHNKSGSHRVPKQIFQFYVSPGRFW